MEKGSPKCRFRPAAPTAGGAARAAPVCASTSTSRRCAGPRRARAREAIRGSLEAKFAFLFEKLAVPNTRELVARYVKPVAPGERVAAVSGPRTGYVRDDEAGD